MSKPGRKRGLAAALIVIGAGFGLASCNVEASAAPSPTCEHRGGLHIPRHGGKLEDDRYHISRGERVTCDGDDKPAEQRHDDGDEDRDREHHLPGHREHKWWRND